MAWLHKRLLVAPMFLGIVSAGICRADAPATGAGDDWFRQQQAQRPATAPGGRDFAPPPAGPPVGPPPGMMNAPNLNGANAGVQSDFPDEQMADWVMASTRAAHARAILRRTENDLEQSVRDAQWNFEHSREYKDAVAAEKQAYDAYIAERQKALQSVVKDPKYLAALELRDKLADQIAYARRVAKPGDVPREILMALATQKLQYATDAHSMEIAALDKDDTLKSDRQKMVQANARVWELRAQFDESIRSNPRILEARRNIEDARVALITAEAYFNAASLAGAQAVDYAYYRHRWDGLRQNNGLSDWGPYGYGSHY